MVMGCNVLWRLGWGNCEFCTVGPGLKVSKTTERKKEE